MTKNELPIENLNQTEKLLFTISNALHARIGTKWDLIMVSASMLDRVKEFLEQGFEPFAITTQKMPKIDAQSKIQLVGEAEDVNIIWMKRPEILAPEAKVEDNAIRS